MKMHTNARLSLKGRELLIERVRATFGGAAGRACAMPRSRSARRHDLTIAKLCGPHNRRASHQYPFHAD